MRSQTDSIKYSVVLPAHRADDYLLNAIQSVEEAIRNDSAELIIIANGPERQNVAELVQRVRSLAKTRIVVSEIPSLVYCLNRGIDIARGEYIARFDSDDICLKTRFIEQWELAKRSGADFTFSDAEVIDNVGNLTGVRKVASAALYKQCLAIHPTAFMKRETVLLLGGYGNLEYSEDYHLWLRALAEGYKFTVDHRPAILYRVHSEQATDKAKLIDTFATNIGIKLTIGIRKRNLRIFLGAVVDTIYLLYRKCRTAFC